MKIRKEVLWFTRQMERKLRENEWKGNWSKCEPQYLLDRIEQEVNELDGSILEDGNKDDIKNTVEETADVANFAMMIADNTAKKRWNKKEVGHG